MARGNSITDVQDRLLKGFSHDSRSTANNSAVAKAIESGTSHQRYFEKEAAPEFSFANADWFKSSLAPKPLPKKKK